MTCSHCGHNADNQATFCSRCGTRFGPPHRSMVREFLITRVARPWWRFIRESTMAFSIVSSFFLLVLGLVVWAALAAHRADFKDLRDGFPAPRAGFTSSMSASKGNFTKAIDAQFAKQCITIDLESSTSFPVSIANDDASFARYNVFVKAGLLTAVDSWVKPSTIFGIAPGTQTVPGKTYSLTDEGRQALRDPRATVFCAGHYKVDEVVDFTVPGNSMGATISRVTFTYSPSDVPAWVSSTGMQAMFPSLAKEPAPKQQGEATMVLKNDGWEAEVELSMF
jgi:hypothetical protein